MTEVFFEILTCLLHEGIAGTQECMLQFIKLQLDQLPFVSTVLFDRPHKRLLLIPFNDGPEDDR